MPWSTLWQHNTTTANIIPQNCKLGPTHRKILQKGQKEGERKEQQCIHRLASKLNLPRICFQQTVNPREHPFLQRGIHWDTWLFGEGESTGECTSAANSCSNSSLLHLYDKVKTKQGVIFCLLTWYNAQLPSYTDWTKSWFVDLQVWGFLLNSFPPFSNTEAALKHSY